LKILINLVNLVNILMDNDLKSINASDMRCCKANIRSLIARFGKHKIRSMQIMRTITTEGFIIEFLRRRWIS
jgi:hypothetical protein